MMRAFLITIIASASISGAAAQQQPAKLTLTCKGMITRSFLGDDVERKPEPVLMSLIFDFTTQSVQGFVDPMFGDPTMADPVAMTATNDVAIQFQGEEKSTIGSSTSWTSGSIDRVTGHLEASSSSVDEKEHKTTSRTEYALQCRPTQRMF